LQSVNNPPRRGIFNHKTATATSENRNAVYVLS